MTSSTDMSTPMTGRLEGKVAIVTGAGRGIGRELALKLAREGARVLANDLDEAPLQALAEDLRKIGGCSRVLAGSVVADDFPQRIVDLAVRELGGLHIVVNNAGFTWDNVIQKMLDEQWDAIIDVHLKAPFRLLRAAQPIIREAVRREREQGLRIVRKVVNVSSMSGVFGNAGQCNYSAAKAGVIGLTQALAKEWGRLDVTVNCVAFGLIKTRLAADLRSGEAITVGGRELAVGINGDLLDHIERQVPLGRAGTTSEAAGAIYLLTTPESDYISGQVVLCSGGLTGI